jgi:hypothetical protein
MISVPHAYKARSCFLQDTKQSDGFPVPIYRDVVTRNEPEHDRFGILID